MKVIDPGHVYMLQILDDPSGAATQTLTFVKRVGPKFPGNVGAHAGTTVQEALRACVDRLAYVYDQKPDTQTHLARYHLMEAIKLLEDRAAERHERAAPILADAVFGVTCVKCGHVGCEGKCHADA